MGGKNADVEITQSDLVKTAEWLARNCMVLNALRVSTYPLVQAHSQLKVPKLERYSRSSPPGHGIKGPKHALPSDTSKCCSS